MSREIRFRGMDIQGRWFYGNLAIVPKNTSNHKAGHYISNSAGMPFAYQVRPELVGQSSGVHEDDNDEEFRELWHGDIIEINYNGNIFNCKVHYETCGFMLVSDGFEDGFIWIGDIMENDGNHFWIPHSKLIGNKYTHPELLEAKHDEPRTLGTRRR